MRGPFVRGAGAGVLSRRKSRFAVFALLAAFTLLMAPSLFAQPPEVAPTAEPVAAPAAHHAGGGEAALVLPDLRGVEVAGVDAHTLLTFGLGICALGLLFGFFAYKRVTGLAVHSAMR